MTDERIGRHNVDDKMMDDFLREQGAFAPTRDGYSFVAFAGSF